MNKTTIIVAAGTGSRVKSEIPKQFISIAGKPILWHTMKKFLDADKNMELLLVLHESKLEEWKKKCREFNFNRKISIVKGGETRFHSVKNGLLSLDGNGLVGVHDAARPLISIKLIKTLFKEAEKHGNAVPAIPVPDSLRWLKSKKNGPADRNAFRQIQTPQVFYLEELTKAFRVAYKAGFTDEATVAENAGMNIHLVEGDPVNFKITHPSDLTTAKALLELGT